jgi:hypothetical protein
MGTEDVRVDSKLNKFLWSQGIKAVPGRVRVRLARKRNDDEEAAEKLYTLCMHVPVEKFQSAAHRPNTGSCRKSFRRSRLTARAFRLAPGTRACRRRWSMRETASCHARSSAPSRELGSTHRLCAALARAVRRRGGRTPQLREVHVGSVRVCAPDGRVIMVYSCRVIDAALKICLVRVFWGVVPERRAAARLSYTLFAESLVCARHKSRFRSPHCVRGGGTRRGGGWGRPDERLSLCPRPTSDPPPHPAPPRETRSRARRESGERSGAAASPPKDKTRKGVAKVRARARAAAPRARSVHFSANNADR